MSSRSRRTWNRVFGKYFYGASFLSVYPIFSQFAKLCDMSRHRRQWLPVGLLLPCRPPARQPVTGHTLGRTSAGIVPTAVPKVNYYMGREVKKRVAEKCVRWEIALMIMIPRSLWKFTRLILSVWRTSCSSLSQSHASSSSFQISLTWKTETVSIGQRNQKCHI